jgi:hypothetical protein
MNDGDDLLRDERLERRLDQIRSDLHALRQGQVHLIELHERRFQHLEDCIDDHENRLRRNTEGVTQLKVQSYVSSGGSWLVSIAAFLKAYLGM